MAGVFRRGEGDPQPDSDELSVMGIRSSCAAPGTFFMCCTRDLDVELASDTYDAAGPAEHESAGQNLCRSWKRKWRLGRVRSTLHDIDRSRAGNSHFECGHLVDRVPTCVTRKPLDSHLAGLIACRSEADRLGWRERRAQARTAWV